MTSTETTTSGRAADDTGHGGRPPADRRTGPSPAEAEDRLVGFALDLVDAPDGSVGLLAPGGGDPALLAVLAASEARPDVHRPTMVLTDTADPAYLRAAHLLGVEAVMVQSDPTSRAAIGRAARSPSPRPAARACPGSPTPAPAPTAWPSPRGAG